VPTDIASQIRRLVEDLESHLVEIDVEEVVNEIDAPSGTIDTPSIVSTRMEMTPSRARGLLPVAAVLLVVVLIGSLWMVRRDRPAGPSSQPHYSPVTTLAGSVDTVPSAPPPTSLPAGFEAMVPPTATFQRRVDAPVGQILVYDDPAADQMCLYLEVELSFGGSCFSTDAIESFDAVIQSWPLPDAPGVAFGLVPVGADVTIEISDTTLHPDEQGLWYAELDRDVVSYVIVTPAGPITMVPDHPPPVTDTTAP
jgi:hypothetical protein